MAAGQVEEAVEEMSSAKQYLLHEQPLQLLPAVVDALAIGGVHHPNQRVRLLEVVLPVGPEGLLAADVPFTASAVSRACERGRICRTNVEFVAPDVHISFRSTTRPHARLLTRRSL